MKRVAWILLASISLLGCREETFHALFPPEGYYAPVLAIDLQRGVLSYRTSAKLKYQGDYSLSLQFGRANPVGVGYSFSELRVRCTVAVPSRPGLSETCDQPLLPFWGESSGISLGRLNVPLTIPKESLVELHVEFLDSEELAALLEAHGPATLVLEKWSDL